MVTPKIHAAIVASPGMGHLIPTMELAKRLATHHGFEVTIFIVTATTTTAGSLDSESNTTKSNILQQTSNLNSLKSLNIIVTPFVDVSDKLDPNKPSLLGQRIMFTLIESLPFIRSQILSMKFPPSVLIVDIFSSIALPMARDLHMSSYVFFSTNAWFTAVSIYIPSMTKEVLLKHNNDQEPLLIPGCESIQFEDTLETLVSPCGSIHDGLLNMIRDMLSTDGILINTWQDLEPTATKAVVEHEILGRFTKGPVVMVDEEGIAMRVKVKDYKLSGEKALSVFGSSHESLCQMAKYCVLHMQSSEEKAHGA
ncbi:coniferyl-alcohol glucosyltransferase [Trifolium repens]|nr:coniferyl-alcohol glucosyltransferase [Trifolium repens]